MHIHVLFSPLQQCSNINVVSTILYTKTLAPVQKDQLVLCFNIQYYHHAPRHAIWPMFLAHINFNRWLFMLVTFQDYKLSKNDWELYDSDKTI